MHAKYPMTLMENWSELTTVQILRSCLSSRTTFGLTAAVVMPAPGRFVPGGGHDRETFGSFVTTESEP